MKLRGEGVDEARREQDRDIVQRWANAGGVDLENEAERAKAKLVDVGRRRK